MTDVELVERAEQLGGARWRTPGCWAGEECRACRGAALWQTLDGLRGTLPQFYHRPASGRRP